MISDNIKRFFLAKNLPICSASTIVTIFTNENLNKSDKILFHPKSRNTTKIF